MSDINYDFKDLLNVGENFNLLYTQMLNGKRIRSEKTGVVYVFDEVGCGKTVSAIIAIASVIKEKQMENEGYKILVLTQKSVCLQFEEEIKEKLKIDSNVIYNVAYDTTNSLKKNIPIYRKEKNCIIVSNPHKIGYLNGKEKRWDLVVIDEAHDLICNNQKQTEAYYTDKINKAYDEYLNDKNFSIERKKYIKDYLNNIDKESSFYNAIYQFVQQIAVEERNEHSQTGRISVPESRSKENVKFRELLNLKSNKLMFLSATPYKNSREMDFINYAFVAAHILTDHTIFAARYLPELDWVQDVYSATEGGKQKMEAANTSFMFKEIAQAIPFDSKDTKIINGKRRIVEIWDSKEDTDILRKNIISKLDKKEEVKNRFLIFVSNSQEGAHVFKKIFPEESKGFDIREDNKHYYKNKNGITCQFIMNKFDNTLEMKSYSKENEKIPDILIVTWQVAQVGINLPTFNYVVNYHIPSIPGYLEQRYGRIDRLNSTNDPLYNIYYLDNNGMSFIYRLNLFTALNHYIEMVVGIPHNLPTKNLLFCDKLKPKKVNINEEMEELYQVLAYYVASYLNEEDDKKNTEEDKQKNVKQWVIKTNTWRNKDIEWNKEKRRLLVGDREYFIRELRENDETNSENDLVEETMEHNIKSISYYIFQLEQGNKMVTQINSAKGLEKLSDAGSIIYWNDNHETIVSNIEEIVKKLC